MSLKDPPRPRDAAPPAPTPYAPSETRILIIVCAGHFLTHAILQLFTAIQPEMQASFGLDTSELTNAASVSMVLYGVGALPAGFLSDRFGERPLLVAFYLVTALGALGVGLAATAWQLWIAFAVLGLGLSIYHPVGFALISKGLSRPARAMGVNGLFGTLGTAAAPLLATQLTRWGASTEASTELVASSAWRWAYLGPAVPTALLAVWTWRQRFAIHVRAPLKRSAAPAGETGTRDAAPAAGNSSRRATLVVFTLLFVSMTCGGVYFSLTTTALPLHLRGSGLFVDANIFPGWVWSDDTRRGVFAFVVLALGGFGQIAAGQWVEKREGRGPYVLVLLAIIPALLATAWLSGWALFGAASLMAVAIFSVQPIENMLLSRYTPAGLRGLAFGLKFIVAFGAGMGLGTALCGTIVERHGTEGVFVASAGFAAVALLAAAVALAIRVRPGGSARENAR